MQESKLHVIDDSLVCNMLGPSFDYAYLPTDGSRGGILVAWRRDWWDGLVAGHSLRAATGCREGGVPG
jgi:hypothetical protein